MFLCLYQPILSMIIISALTNRLRWSAQDSTKQANDDEFRQKYRSMSSNGQMDRICCENNEHHWNKNNIKPKISVNVGETKTAKKRVKRFTFESRKILKWTKVDNQYLLNITMGSELSDRMKQVIDDILNSIQNVTNITFIDGQNKSFHYSIFTPSSSTPINYYELERSNEDTLASIKINSLLENSSLIVAHNVLLQATLMALGLGKSSDVNAVMYPKIGSTLKNLSDDDIAGLQMLYGFNVNNSNSEFLGKNPKAFDL